MLELAALGVTKPQTDSFGVTDLGDSLAYSLDRFFQDTAVDCSCGSSRAIEFGKNPDDAVTVN